MGRTIFPVSLILQSHLNILWNCTLCTVEAIVVVHHVHSCGSDCFIAVRIDNDIPGQKLAMLRALSTRRTPKAHRGRRPGTPGTPCSKECTLGEPEVRNHTTNAAYARRVERAKRAFTSQKVVYFQNSATNPHEFASFLRQFAGSVYEIEEFGLAGSEM